MKTIYVTYDKRSGRIMGVAPTPPDEAHRRARRFESETAPSEDQTTIGVPADAVSHGTLYKVDVDRKVLVATTTQSGGVSFSFGTATPSLAEKTTKS